MSKIPSSPIQMETWQRCPGGRFFCCFRGTCLFFFCFFFQIHFGIVYIWHMCHSFDQRICFTVNFFLSKRALFSSKYNFFLLNCQIFCPSSCYHSNYFDGELWPGHLSWFINSNFYAPSYNVWLFEKFTF